MTITVTYLDPTYAKIKRPLAPLRGDNGRRPKPRVANIACSLITYKLPEIIEVKEIYDEENDWTHEVTVVRRPEMIVSTVVQRINRGGVIRLYGTQGGRMPAIPAPPEVET